MAVSRVSGVCRVFFPRRAGRRAINKSLNWLFRNRETGALTIAQAPNLLLWIAIVAAALKWVLRPQGRAAVALEIALQGAMLLWALDELLRGVNPWRRCLGAIVLVYLLATLHL